MIHARGNVLGIIMFIVGGVIAGVGGFVFKLGDATVMIMVGTALFLMDLIIRLRVRNQKGWLMSKLLGGYFFFVPVWILGVIVIVVNTLNGLGILS
ncbi:MAG: hypothetical protein J0L96_21065 [Anaerolineae bacterium]|nr:hypothetical protein [Anaerolineae bacterium]